MSKIVQWKRGNTTVSSTYVGAQGEITVNTDDYSLYVHDGVTPGGYKISNDSENITAGIDANLVLESGNYTLTWDINGNLTPNTTGNIVSMYVISGTIVRTVPSTIDSLPLPNVAGAGSRAFVTDANTVSFGSIVGGGASNTIPIYSDGTDWRVG